MQGYLGYLLFMDLVDKSAFYIYVFSRNILARLDAVYSSKVELNRYIHCQPIA